MWRVIGWCVLVYLRHKILEFEEPPNIISNLIRREVNLYSCGMECSFSLSGLKFPTKFYWAPNKRPYPLLYDAPNLVLTQTCEKLLQMYDYTLFHICNILFYYFKITLETRLITILSLIMNHLTIHIKLLTFQSHTWQIHNKMVSLFFFVATQCKEDFNLRNG